MPKVSAMRMRVFEAFRVSGGFMLGTPFATASAPVSATEPEANARRIRRTDSAVTPVAGTGSGGIAGAGTSPESTRKSP